jgi:hypothetical protein
MSFLDADAHRGSIKDYPWTGVYIANSEVVFDAYGYNLPEDENDFNRITGTSTGSMVMAFPRSVEGEIGAIPALAHARPQFRRPLFTNRFRIGVT